jgi:hypothetical protein
MEKTMRADFRAGISSLIEPSAWPLRMGFSKMAELNSS